MPYDDANLHKTLGTSSTMMDMDSTCNMQLSKFQIKHSKFSHTVALQHHKLDVTEEVD